MFGARAEDDIIFIAEAREEEVRVTDKSPKQVENSETLGAFCESVCESCSSSRSVARIDKGDCSIS